MPQLRYLNCLLLVVHSEEDPDVWKPPAPPLDSATVKRTVKMYALLPSIQDQYPEEFEILRRSFVNFSVPLISSVVEFPRVLTSAVREDRTEIVEALLDIKHAEYEKLIVKVDIFNETLVHALLDQPFFVEGVYSRCDMDLPHPYSNYDSRSVLEEANHAIFELLATLKADLRYRCEKGGTLLHFAIEKHYEPLVRLLLQNGAQPEARTLEGLTPLHVAVDTIHTPASIVDLLMQHGANVNATVTDSDDSTPLCSALFGGYCGPDVIRSLLDNGARKDDECLVNDFQQLVDKSNPEALDCYLSYRPHLSVETKRETLRAVLKRSSSKRTVKVLLKYGFDLVPDDATNPEVFFGAVRANSLELVQILLNWGASANARTEKGLTPLHTAVRESFADEEMIQLLLAHGADINAKTNWGETPLSSAVSGKLETLAYLLANGARLEDDPTILHKAVECVWGENYLEKVKLLLECGADVNYRNDKGETPLSLAASEDNKEILEILSRYGAFIDPEDTRVHNALLCHIEQGNLDVLQILLQTGANIEAIMEDALITAVEEHRQPVIRFLLEFYDPRALTVDMGAVLEQAILGGRPNIVEDILTNVNLRIHTSAVNNLFDEIKNICSHYEGNTTSSYLLSLRADAFDIRDAVCCHICAVQAAKLSINQDRADHTLPDWLFESALFYSQEDCELQVAAMKSTMIGESGVSFFDILDASAPKIVRYLKDERIVNVLKGDRYGDFPIYRGIISKLFRRAFYRRSLMNQGIKMMDFLCLPFRGLSLELKEIIMDYLSNQNLLVLTNVCKLPAERRR